MDSNANASDSAEPTKPAAPAKKPRAAPAKKPAKSSDVTGIGMPKKPSPRARTPKAAAKAPDASESSAPKKRVTAAEKKKAAAAAASSAAQAAKSAAAVTNNGSAAKQQQQQQQQQAAASSASSQAAMTTATSATSSNASAGASASELHPIQDGELRKAYLQQIYRQLQITHRDQDDAIIRQVATSLEMEVCRKAASRGEYIATLNYELNKLMQSELANGSGNSAGAYNGSNASAQVGGYQGAPTSEAMSTGHGAKNAPANPAARQGAAGYASAQAQVRSHEQASLKGGGGATNAPGSDGSFMQSLMTDQNAAAAYNASKGQQQQPGASVYSASPSGMQRNSVDGSTPHGYEFAAQVQHFDKNALIELLWSQRNSLIQWQRRASQLEALLSSRYNPAASSGIPSPYYSGTPPGAHAYGPSVPANVSNEAELERAAMRRNARGQQQPQQYAPPQQPHYGGGATAGSPMPNAPAGQPSGAANPLVYWEKVRALKDAYSQELYLAHCALSQHHVSPNTAQSLKAENVKHNISLAMNVLSEAPKNVQPRPLEVLHSIERFIQNTVIPIVQRVQMSQSPHAPSPMAGVSNYQSTPGASSSGPSASASYAPSASGQAVVSGSATPTHAAARQAQAVDAAAQNPATDNKPTPAAGAASAAAAKGKKAKAAESTAAPKMPPRAKQAAESKGATKRLSKATEAKLAAAAAQQPPTSAAPAQTQQHVSAPQQASARIGDGLQSPFGAGASSLEKTPTVSPNENRTVGSTDESAAKAMALDAASKHAAAVAHGDNSNNNNNRHEDAEDDDDALNDFADFPELDFDEEMAPMKLQFNKENTSFNTKKRSIGDV